MSKMLSPNLYTQLRRHLLAVGLGLSLLLHFLFMAASLTLPYFQPQIKPVTIEIVEPTKTKNKDRLAHQQIVREALTPEKLKVDESTDPLKFLSRQTQRVQKQTRAALNGLTQNRSPEISPEKNTENKTENHAKNKSPKDLAEKGDLFYPQKKSKKILDAYTPQYKKTPNLSTDHKLDRGVSTIGEALPREVELGSFTALNTDRYLYYSFFSRIEELIRFNWENMVRQSIDRTPPDRFKTNISGTWNTQLEIWLKPNGEFHSAHLLKESGFRGFDQAAVMSFAQARLFPNPPKEMVEEDGYIHLKYYFQVHYEPKVLVNNN